MIFFTSDLVEVVECCSVSLSDGIESVHNIFDIHLTKSIVLSLNQTILAIASFLNMNYKEANSIMVLHSPQS